MNKLKKKVFFRTKNGWIGVLVEDIQWIKSNRHSVIIHTDLQELEVRSTLKQIEIKMFEYGFIQIHRCYLVNTSKVDQINNLTREIAVGKDVLTVSVSCWPKFKFRMGFTTREVKEDIAFFA